MRISRKQVITISTGKKISNCVVKEIVAIEYTMTTDYLTMRNLKFV